MNRTIAILTAVFSLAVIPVKAETYSPVAHTNSNTLNDLVRGVQGLSVAFDRDLLNLSSAQELLVLFEREMRGEGLPAELADAFARNYSAIICALVEDRIDEAYGRDLLSVHRQLLYKTQEWTRKRVRDETFDEEVIENIEFFLTELEEKAIPLFDVPQSMRTPVINGYQVWLGELLQWGCETGYVLPYHAAVIRRQASDLERFECYYKKDGCLHPYEREDLHKRFIKLARETSRRIGRY